MHLITLDTIIGLDVSEDDYFNEIRTIQSLQLGLAELALRIRHEEEPIRREEMNEGVQLSFFGNRPGMNRHIIMLMPCFFHWFGVSLCNYVRLIGFINGLQSGRIKREMLEDKNHFGVIKNECSSYAKSVGEIQDILIWRNKVGAHFAITDPRKEDNPATLDMSVIHPVSYGNGRFRVHALALGRTDKDGNTYSSNIPQWSITEVWEHLSNRYWPSLKFPSSEAND